MYSHRSTQKYKRKPFISHYWDCRLKGRPSGTKKSTDPNIKRRKREKRELGLCDVKIKVTEWFGRVEAEQLGMTAVALGEGDADFGSGDVAGGAGQVGLQVVMENETSPQSNGVMEGQGQSRWPKGHPGADGKKWYTVQRVSGLGAAGGKGGAGDEDDEDEDMNGEGKNPDHKHTLEESDRIKKNTVQRWILKEEKERRAGKKVCLFLSYPRHEELPLISLQSKIDPSLTTTHSHTNSTTSLTSSYLASGPARATVRLHQPSVHTHLTFFANAFCPFAQRVWIALELKNIPYQFVEVTPEMLQRGQKSQQGGQLRDGGGVYDRHTDNAGLAATATTTSPPKSTTVPNLPQDLLSVNPEAIVPCIKHGNWGIWESNVMMEYLEDLTNDIGQNVGGVPLLPVGQPQLKAHCRLWVDHVNRKVLPAFYALLLTPPPRRRSGASPGSGVGDGAGAGAEDDVRESQHSILITTLQTAITSLVNASHAIGPFFLGSEISYVDVAFAPWIIRLSRVLSYYRNFPRPEVGTRWQRWVQGIEGDERVRRTVSEEGAYHGVYRGVGEDGVGVLAGGEGGRVDGGVNGDRDDGGRKVMVEIDYARKIMSEEGFGLGGDLYGKMGLDPDGRDWAGDGGDGGR